MQSIKSLPKKSIKYLPGFGQLLWALEYPFLERNNFQKDKETIAAVAKVYKSFPFPLQVRFKGSAMGSAVPSTNPSSGGQC